MANQSIPAPDTLAALAIAFTNFRKSSGLKRPVIPQPLKRRALAFLECEAKHEVIGQACGVSKQTIVLWRSQMVPIPRKLVVVHECDQNKPETPLEVASMQSPSAQSILFRLPSGISFDLSREDAVWLVSKLSEVK